MILPIVAYGDPILKRETEYISKDMPDLKELIDNMFQTMYKANGVGLAAPQIGKSLRLFIIDSTAMYDEDEQEKGKKQVFINAEIVEETGETFSYEEGCLSIPGVRENVSRLDTIKIKYFDENFKQHEEILDDMTARVIQHEYDHIEGILFTDHLKPLKRRLMKRRLTNITKGQVRVQYKMKFPKK